MPKYMTKQRKMLLSYLSEHADEQLSARQIAAELEDRGISTSAVYRNLAELDGEGKVRRFTKGGSREVYYQYTDADACRECLHLSCKLCGKTYHMDTQDADMLIKSVARNENFAIDRSETVLYGICEDCQDGKTNKD